MCFEVCQRGEKQRPKSGGVTNPLIEGGTRPQVAQLLAKKVRERRKKEKKKKRIRNTTSGKFYHCPYVVPAPGPKSGVHRGKKSGTGTFPTFFVFHFSANPPSRAIYYVINFKGFLAIKLSVCLMYQKNWCNQTHIGFQSLIIGEKHWGNPDSFYVS